AIQRRVYQAGGPVLLFRRAKGTSFPLVANLFGTLDRAKFIFRDALEAVRRLVELKIDPGVFGKNPWRYRGTPRTLLRLLPRRVRSGPILAHRIAIDQLPQIQCWPVDGGPFVTLPQVYTEDPDRPGLARSNLGMYRVQLGGNQYVPNREVGLHYQIHRGIGVHHAAAIQRGEALRVNVFVGGPPALSVAAVMPLPEGLPELAFAGALGGRRVAMVTPDGSLPMPAEADFVICGSIDPRQRKPEGPFGDHLGYYSLQHDYPVLSVERVYHRDGAIWPFTSVGRPPQEDTTFGALIHELTGPIIPTVVPGVQAVHAVDAAGVHPLLLAIARERYIPDAPVRRPQEILTIANALLGQGQLSLAKYLLIVAQEDDPSLDIHDIGRFLRHLLERVDWRTDLHFQTQTTIDTLDYSGHGLNQGSKVVIAAAGPLRRTLATELPDDLRLPSPFRDPRVVLPGILAIEGQPYGDRSGDAIGFCKFFETGDSVRGFPLIVLVDDSAFAAKSERNFLWVTFTRSNPAADIEGIGSFIDKKHWGCTGSLVIDARKKPHHAPPLVDDPKIERKVDELAAPGGPLHGVY
ncbi:MAG TPA: UbiD family decarboxylase, partial [Isosphaeraceae bacterium]|nr:UbiD family decarboxylase [Isosphaeraceae bacterium]